MKVSCIIPVYNVSRHLRKCVDSVLNQTYSSFEVILVNDCSTDNSADICRQYRDAHPDKVIFIDKPRNEGVDKARFTGLEYVFTSNKWGGVTFIDSDDYIQKDAFRRLVAEMVRSDADVVQMNMNRVLGFIRRPHYSPVKSQVIGQPTLFDDYYISFFGVNSLNVCMYSKLYKIETIAKAKLKPTGFRMGEDLMFNMKLFPFFKRYSVIDYNGYNYRVGGLTSKYNPTLWDDLSRQYKLKRQIIDEYGYKKGIRTLNIELKNIFISAIAQRIQFLNENNEQIGLWIKEQLRDDMLWHDFPEMAITENDTIYKSISEVNIEHIISVASQKFKSTRKHRFVKNFLSLIIR